MSLNIKDEETHRLVRRLSELTGQNQTAAVREAVQRRIDELSRETAAQRRYELLDEISRRARAAADPEWLATDWDAELYDENGLPR